jgi:hypothetical protein
MDRQYGEARFRSAFVRDRADGYAGYELLRMYDGVEARVARVIFWDACGQLFVETTGTDVPLAILEEVIAEAKASVKTS